MKRNVKKKELMVIVQTELINNKIEELSCTLSPIDFEIKKNQILNELDKLEEIKGE